MRSQPFARSAPFLIFIIDSRARIVKRQNFQNTKDKKRTTRFGLLRLGRAARHFLTHSDAIRRFYLFSQKQCRYIIFLIFQRYFRLLEHLRMGSFWVPMIFQSIHLRLVFILIIEESLSNVNSPAPIKSPRARSLAEPRPQTMWDKSLHARTYNVYHYRPCACNTCFIAIQLFNAAALNCISQICCYLEHFHIQGLRGLPRWV